MKVRSITIGLPLTQDVSRAAIEAAGEFATQAKQQLEAAGLEVQTVRLAAPPLSNVLENVAAEDAAVAAMQYAGAVGQAAKEGGFNYVSLGPVLAVPPTSNTYALIEALPEVLEQAEGLFVTVQTGGLMNGRRMVNVKAANAAAQSQALSLPKIWWLQVPMSTAPHRTPSARRRSMLGEARAWPARATSRRRS